MQVANLSLCKELCNLSSWGDDTAFVYYVNGGQYGGEFYHRTQVMAKPGNIPAYDLGYLLRKLPHEYELAVYWAAIEQWEAGYIWDDNIYKYRCVADTPENALCSLAIELFKQGVLSK